MCFKAKIRFRDEYQLENSSTLRTLKSLSKLAKNSEILTHPKHYTVDKITNFSDIFKPYFYHSTFKNVIVIKVANFSHCVMYRKLGDKIGQKRVIMVTCYG